MSYWSAERAPRNREDVAGIEAQGLPSDLPTSTFDLFERTAAVHGDDPALAFFLEARFHDRIESCSYRDLLDQITRTANLFHGLGVGADQVVGILLPNLPETHFCLWGAEAAGIAFPINPLLEPEAICDLLKASRAHVLVTLAPFAGTDLHAKAIAALKGAPDVKHLILVDLAPHVPGLRRLPARLMQARLKARAPQPAHCAVIPSLSKAVQRQSADGLDNRRVIGADDIASMFATGGTTGAPKIALRTHRNEIVNAWMASRMTLTPKASGETVFCGLPLFHVNGAMVTGLAAFLLGVRVLIGSPQGYRGEGLIDRFWRIVAHHRVSSFSGVPTLFSALLQRPVGDADLSSLQFAICGAAPMSPDLIAQFQDETGVRILEGYGLTEATCVASVHSLEGVQKVGSVGLPLPFQKVTIARRHADTGEAEILGAGETGSVLLAGPNIFRGYRDSRHDADLWVEIDGRRWLDTGDLGMLDEDGFLWLKGRSKDLIIRGGHNIDPAMIEDAFYSHPAVVLAAAIGRPDVHAGEVPVVYVELAEGSDATVEDLARHADSRIHERAARPRAILIVPSMPLTAIGKVHKPTLREIDARTREGVPA